MANNKRKRQARKKATPRDTKPTNTSSSRPSTLFARIHITDQANNRYVHQSLPTHRWHDCHRSRHPLSRRHKDILSVRPGRNPGKWKYPSGQKVQTAEEQEEHKAAHPPYSYGSEHSSLSYTFTFTTRPASSTTSSSFTSSFVFFDRIRRCHTLVIGNLLLWKR
jgi:hypothetical protein